MVLPEGLPTVEEASDEATAVVLDTLPNSETELKEWFDGKEFQAIYFKNRIKEAYYLTGYGTREQFARLYKTIYQFPEFDVRINQMTSVIILRLINSSHQDDSNF